MTKEEVGQKMREIVMDILNVEERELKQDASFSKDLYADSLDRVEIVIAVEREFGIYLKDEEAEEVETFGDAVELVCQKVKAV